MKKLYTLTLMLLALTISVSAQTGNVGIGTNTPDNSAILDINSSDKGLLVPRISLGNVSTFGLSGGTSTIGMLIYNTNASTIGGTGVGFYYWTGSSWTKVVAGTTATLNNGQIWIGNASNQPVGQTMSGDATISNTGVIDLTNGAVETSEIADNAVDGTKINISGNTNGSLMYYNGTDWVNLAPSTSGQILRTNGAGAPTWNNPNDLFVFENGLTEVAPNIVRLGGTLMQNTTITQGSFNMAYNLTGDGDFDIQDNGSSALFVRDNGNVGIGTNAPNSKLDVRGILAMNDYGIQLRSATDANHQIIFSSAIDGPSIQGCQGIEFRKKCTEEQLGTWNTTALDVINSQIYAREGLKTRKTYLYYQDFGYCNCSSGWDQSRNPNLGTWDFCAVGHFGFKNNQSNNDEDDDVQCAVYPTYSGFSSGAGEQTFYNSTMTRQYNEKPTWYMYFEAHEDSNGITCAANCINFE